MIISSDKSTRFFFTIPDPSLEYRKRCHFLPWSQPLHWTISTVKHDRRRKKRDLHKQTPPQAERPLQTKKTDSNNIISLHYRSVMPSKMSWFLLWTDILFLRQQVFLLSRLHAGRRGLVLLQCLRHRPPVGMGRVRGRAVWHGLLHQLARSQHELGGDELHRLLVLFLLHYPLHRHFPVLHVHLGDRPGLPPGRAAACGAAEQDCQRPNAHRQGNWAHWSRTCKGVHVCVTDICCLLLSSQMSVAVCIGFLAAWSPYAIVSMWAAFGNPATVPPMAFAIAAIFAKSSTLYNPIVYLVFKPNFRKFLCRDVARCRRTLSGCLCQRGSAEKTTCQQECNSTRFLNGIPESHGKCRHCPYPQTVSGNRDECTDYSPQQTVRILKGSLHHEVAVSQLSNELQSDFL